jgi:O-antigen polymerase
MHIFLPNIGGVLAQQREYIIWLTIGSIILIGILNALIKRRQIESPLRIYIFLFVALLLLSSIFNPIKNMNLFIISSARLIAGILLWLALLQFDLTHKEKISILFLIFVSAVIESVIGTMQFFGLYRYIPITPAPDIGMAGGVFQQKNLFASWIASGFIISLYLITTNRFKNYSSSKMAIFWICVVLLSLSLIIASSRTGLLGITLAMIVMFSTRKRHYSVAKKNLIIWLVAFLIGTSGGFYLLTIKDKLGIEKLTIKQIKWFSDTGQTSYAERILMYKTSLEMFKEKPLFGQGFSNFGSLYMYYQGKVKKAEPQYKEVGHSYTSHPHNELFLIVSESGIAGIVGVLILIYGYFRLIIRYRKERAGLYTAFLMPFVVHMLVEYPLHLSTAHYFTFIILLYLSTAHFLKVSELKLSQRAVRGIMVLLFSTYIIFAAYTVKTFIAYNQFVIWYIDNIEDRKSSEANIMPAIRNIYLRNWAIPMNMFAKAEEAVKDIEKNRDFLDDFVKWSEHERRRLPVLPAFQYDALVLLNLGIYYKQHVYFDEAMKTVEEGLLLYPNNEDLKKLRPKIAAEAFKIIFDEFQRGKKD